MTERVTVSTNDLLAVLDGKLSGIIRKVAQMPNKNVIDAEDIAVLKMALDVFRCNYDPFAVYDDLEEVAGDDTEGNGS